MHNYKYPLGHFITAKYWHCVNPDGLHLTISDTGWAKAHVGQAVRPVALRGGDLRLRLRQVPTRHDILPMFKKYNITTFCAPPTMYRMIIKEDLTKYDLSTVEHATICGRGAKSRRCSTSLKSSRGYQIMEGFGQTETTAYRLETSSERPTSSAQWESLRRSIDVSSSITDGNAGAGTGEIGRDLHHARRQAQPCGLFTGYYREQEKTTPRHWHDGYYHTRRHRLAG